MLAVGGLLALSPALLAADTNAPANPTTNAPAAGGGRGGRMMGGPSLDQLATQLALTDDQKTKVKPILDDRDQKLKDLRADTTLSQQDRRDKMQKIRDDVTTKLKDVLTPDQFDKFQKAQLAIRQRYQRGGAGNAAAPAAPAPAPQQ